MLFLVALNRIARADTAWPIPDHILTPSSREQLWRALFVRQVIYTGQILNHLIDESECFLPSTLVLRGKQ